jgi:DHA1 family tetracycline resistance protein-like MFS transporter
MLVLGGVALAVVQFLMVQRLAPRYGEKLVAMGSLFGQAASSVALFFAPLLWMIFPFYMIANAFSGFTFPTMTTLTTNRVLPHEVGLLMGVTTAIGSLMNIAGPLWAGLVYDAVMPGAPYWMGALVYVVAAFMLVRVKNMAPLQEPLPVMQAAE